MPELDKKSASVFAGKVVRKDLVYQVKVVGPMFPSLCWNTCWGSIALRTILLLSRQG